MKQKERKKENTKQKKNVKMQKEKKENRSDFLLAFILKRGR